MSRKKKTSKREKESMPKIKKQAKELKIKAKDKKIAGDPEFLQSSPTRMSDPEFVGKQVGDTLMLAPEFIKAIATGKIDKPPRISKMKTRAMYQGKKHGGKITYKMTGGQVVDSSYD